MKRLILLALILFSPRLLAQEKPGNDPIGKHLFSPELILQYQEEIALTDEQRRAIMSAVQEIQNAGPQTNAQIESAVKGLEQTLSKDHVNEESALAQLEKLQRQQVEQTRKQIGFLIQIKNQLTSEQQTKLTEFRKKGPGQYPPPALKEKLETLQSKIQDSVGAGHDPVAVSELMQEFEPLIRNGKLGEADALLNRALKMVQE